jgi:DNA-directed RNA polymerase specialized sigma24 family protein
MTRATEPTRPYADTLARIADGDGAALAVLYDDFAPVVLGLARQQLHRAADAGTITDAVFLEVRWLAAVPPATDRGVLAWILDIAHRRIRDRNHPNHPPAHHAPLNLFDHDAHTHQELGTFLRTGAPAIAPLPGVLRRRGAVRPAE